MSTARHISAVALALSIVATAGTSAAKSPEPTRAPSTGASPAPVLDQAADDDDRAAAVADAEAKPLTIAPLLGISGGGYGVGVGVRAGYTLESNVYLGGAFVYHLGTSTKLFDTKTSVTTLYPSFEGGYDLRFGRLLVRPYGGLAYVVSTMTSKYRGLSESATVSSPAIYPGCVLTYDIPDSSVFVGGDARLMFNLDSGGSAFAAFGSAGMRF